MLCLGHAVLFADKAAHMSVGYTRPMSSVLTTSVGHSGF